MSQAGPNASRSRLQKPVSAVSLLRECPGPGLWFAFSCCCLWCVSFGFLSLIFGCVKVSRSCFKLKAEMCRIFGDSELQTTFREKLQMWQLHILKDASAINDKVVETVMENTESAL